MKIRVSLGDADRERYGAPEVMDVDFDTLSWAEMIPAQKGVEIGGVVCSFDSPGQFIDGLNKVDPFARIFLLWLALRRAGIQVPLAEVDIPIFSMTTEVVTEATDPAEPGKDQSSLETTS